MPTPRLLKTSTQQFAGWFTLLIIICSGISLYLYQYLWPVNSLVIHSAIELCGIMLAVFIFLVVWQTADTERQLDRLIAYGFLMVSIFDLLHLYFYSGLKLFPPGYTDLSARMVIVSYIIQALMAIVIVTGIKTNRSYNRWPMLFGVVLMAVIIASLIYLNPLAFPSLTTKDGFSTLHNAARIVILLAFCCCLVVSIKQKSGFTYGNIRFLLALSAAILVQITVVTSQSVGYMYILGHTFKLASYVCVFIGVSSRAFIDPYYQLKAIFNQLPLGMIIYDPSGNIRLLNQHLQELQTAVQGIPELEEALNPSPANVKQVPSSSLIQLPQSEQQMLLIQHNLIKLPDGNLMHLYTDVSYEQELTDLRFQTQTILNAIPNPVIIIDEKKRVIATNPTVSRLLNIKVLPGQNIRDVVESLTYIITGHAQSCDEESNTIVHSYEISLLHKDGVLKLLVNYSIIKGMQTEIRGYVLVIQDVTAINAHHELVKQREKLAVLGQMAAGIVHEIKNPLTSIRGFSQLLLNEQIPERERSYIEVILETSDEVNRVVSDFLSFASPRPPRLSYLSLNNLIESVRYLIQGNSFMKDVNLKFALTPLELPVYADEQQLRQVILNITKNALEALEGVPKPLLIISTQLAYNQQEMILSITDNGPGIDLEEQSYLGTPFFTTKDGGTGLGLSICYQIIKEHGGQIQVVSQPGEGTGFFITLPVAIDHHELIK